MYPRASVPNRNVVQYNMVCTTILLVRSFVIPPLTSRDLMRMSTPRVLQLPVPNLKEEACEVQRYAVCDFRLILYGELRTSFLEIMSSQSIYYTPATSSQAYCTFGTERSPPKNRFPKVVP